MANDSIRLDNLSRGPTLLLQTAVPPFFVADFNDQINVQLVRRTKIGDVLSTVERYVAGKEPFTIFVNIGPGSYTGIRQGIAYTLGLALGYGSVQVYTYTTFDLVLTAISLATKKDINSLVKKPIFIQGLPRLVDIGEPTAAKDISNSQSVTKMSSDNLLGYLRYNQRVEYVKLGAAIRKYQISNVLIYSDKDLAIENKEITYTKIAPITLAQTLKEVKSLPLLVETLKSLATSYDDLETLQDLTPLYVNPVNITS